MTGKQLKNSILQWAIQGKLVPQDPNDEPASVLLEKIRAEKARLVKEGKIKKDKNESIIYRGEDNSYYEKFLATGEVKCIDDEIPFEIPDRWEWCRLGHLVDFSKSSSVKANQIPSAAWLLDLEDIEKDTGILLQKKRMGRTVSLSDKHQFNAGNVLYSKLRPYLNKVIIADEDGYCTSEILCFDFGFIYNRYAQIFLMSPYFVEYAMNDAYGVKMPRLGSKQGNKGLIPIPPYKEQLRIVQFIDSLQPSIDKYSTAQSLLNSLNIEIKEQIRKSILQEAIQGKLVPQNPDDEPASVLLQRIKEEKQKLVKEGKLKKKDVVDSIIFKGDDNKYYEQVGSELSEITDNIPFDIPNGWEWCRLRDICYIFTGATFKKEDTNTARSEIRILRGGNILPYRIVMKADDIFLAKENVKEAILLRQDDIITPAVTSLENIGKMARVKEDMSDTTVGGFVFVLRPHYRNSQLSKFLLFLMSSPSIIEYIKSITNKSGQAFYNIGKERIAMTLIPIPPIAEQQRIVDMIETVFYRIKD